jgi:putative OPT family oligopeptide transporter
MTVSASIPAAVISMGILRGLLRRGTILENNIVQTATSAGESLAAGIIFTIPALVIAGIWMEFDYWGTTLVALLGGFMGILFMIPLRRAMIVEETELVYPEGVACAEVLKAGEEKGIGIVHVFLGVVVGALFKFLIKGLSVVKETVEVAVRAGRTAFYGGSDMSAMLVGVGYIVGPNIAVLVFLGGAIAWFLAIPLYGAVNGIPEGPLLDEIWTLWSHQIRYLGIGAMIVGGIWSILRVRQSLVRGFKGAVLGYRRAEQQDVPRIERDLSQRWIGAGLLLLAIPVFLLYASVAGSAAAGIVAGVAMIVSAFFFVAVASHITGLVGSSNAPVSGMIIVTVLFASILLLLFRLSGTRGILAALMVGGVVACATATAADVSQDLKTGYLVGATPRNQQLAQMLGVLAAAFIIVPVLTVLHRAYGIGTGEPRALQAPQASLFAGLVRGVFADQALPWTMAGAGALIGVLLIFVDEILRFRGSRFRMHVMPVAVGIYLPLSLAVPILIGGMLSAIVRRFARRCPKDRADAATRCGTLFSSGIIAGESIMGILLAVLLVAKVDLPVPLVESDLLSILVFATAVAGLVWVTIREVKK